MEFLAAFKTIYVRSRRAGDRVMASLSRFLTRKLRLKVNEAKSAVARPEERKSWGSASRMTGAREINTRVLDKLGEDRVETLDKAAQASAADRKLYKIY
jgi:RNA-directed DNA polymerase